MIFLAGLGLTASVISLLYLSQHLIASKSNEIDQQRSVLSVEGAVQTSVNRVLSLVLDNAIWDDAVTQTYAPRLDQKWLYDTWGSGFKINNLYDGTFVLDEHYHILWGAFQSQVMPRTDLSFLGAGLTSLIRYHAKALREAKTPSPASRAPRQGSLSSASA
jgi:sensor domain CHASE-containing protein